MDIRKFSTGGEEYPVSFPFDAIVDLMGSLGFRSYFTIYQSPVHQLKVLKIGLKYGYLNSAERFKLSDKQIRNLVRTDPKFLADVYRFYDKELAEFVKLYEEDESQDSEKPETEKAESEGEQI